MLLQQLAAAADTIFVRQVPPVRTLFEQVAFVASGLVSVLLLVLLGLLLVSLGAMRRRAEEMRHKLDLLLAELRPMTQDAKATYQEVREVVKDVKEMVDESRTTVRDVSQRVRHSVGALADRVDRMGALIGRVNDTAESMATIASTTMGGIKLGARAMGLGKRKKKSKPPAERPRLRRKD
jgi:methyl-accepting chemotaxis protein